MTVLNAAGNEYNYVNSIAGMLVVLLVVMLGI